ncbi:MAG TPA: SUMF1/EgtB/PvdO family nonheme iron enzyme [Planctomycetota bacterium]|nr:SUMF1/EgtB/PvdO family nonheme iron enzyme [Planctomycetota bacterium]
MIVAEILALLVLALSPAASQATFIQAPESEGETPAAEPAPAASNDIRLVLRQTDDDGKSELPPGMVEIPKGQVVMGTPVESIQASAKTDEVLIAELLAETPRHSVDVDAYYIDLTEVTNLQWKVFLDATGRKPSPALVEFGWPTGDIPEGQEQFPITNVNLPEIRQFLSWCGKRLPDEAEWTRAARGDDERVYPWGDKWEAKLCRSAASGSPGSVAVGLFPQGASPFGVLDMAGNVFEWVDSPFKEYPGFQPLILDTGKKKSNTIAPPFNSSWRVIKGGSFTTIQQFTRIDVRLGQSIVESDAALGFRCARSITPGLEAVRNGLALLGGPPLQFVKVGIDESDVVAREIDSYDDKRKVITGYRYLAFAHRAPVKGPSLTQLRKTARDDFLPLGVIVSSEGLRFEAMLDKAALDKAEAMPNATAQQKAARQTAIESAQRVLPAGEYTVLFKSEGESKAYKEQQKGKPNGKAKDEDKPAGDAPAKPDAKSKSKNGKGKGKSDEAAEPEAGDEPPAEAMVPWPGLASIHDLEEDIAYPQDADLLLFLNANNVVVGFAKPLAITEEEVADADSTRSDDGREWTIEFSLNQMTSKKGPRFKFGLELAGEGL